MKKGPHLILYDFTDTERMSEIDFGAIVPGTPSQEIAVWLWNKRNFSDAPDATDVRINVKALNKGGEEVINDDAVKVKSDGVMDPDSTGIVDDSESSFSHIGGDLTDENTYHSIGDIPSNCARRLIFRIDSSQDLVLEVSPVLKFQAGYLSDDVDWLYSTKS